MVSDVVRCTFNPPSLFPWSGTELSPASNADVVRAASVPSAASWCAIQHAVAGVGAAILSSASRLLIRSQLKLASRWTAGVPNWPTSELTSSAHQGCNPSVCGRVWIAAGHPTTWRRYFIL